MACFMAYRYYKKIPMATMMDFRVMSFEEQCSVITFSGDYLTHRTQGDQKVFLYHSTGFYIEVFYSAQRAKVLKISSFEKLEELEPYLQKISLSDLGF